jgi:hypothetical protein
VTHPVDRHVVWLFTVTPRPSLPLLNARSTAPSSLAAARSQSPLPQASIAGGVTGAHRHCHLKNPNPNSTCGPAATTCTTTGQRCGDAPTAVSHRSLGRHALSPSSPPPSSSSASGRHLWLESEALLQSKFGQHQFEVAC